MAIKIVHHFCGSRNPVEKLSRWGHLISRLNSCFRNDEQVESGSVKRERGRIWLITAILLTCSCCQAADDHRFGRLFTTPEQRQRLQELREEHGQTRHDRDDVTGSMSVITQNPGMEQAGSSSTSADASKPPPVVTLKGLIYRNGGTRRAWVEQHDGLATPEYRELQAQARPDSELAIPVPMDGKSVMLKPGQSYHPDSGLVTEIIQ